MGRRDDVDRLYDILSRVSDAVGGPRRLGDCDGYLDWPERGVYVFLEPGARRRDGRRRVTRVGTHAVSAGSGTSLWSRLKQHYGTGAGSSDHPHGGNHRGSVYRLRVGEALIERHGLHDRYPDWGTRTGSLDRDRATVREEEYPLERRVSAYIRDQPFLWVAIDDEPGPDSDRALVEQTLIALLSNVDGEQIDRRPAHWLGRHSRSPEIRASGLWNVDHVRDEYDPAGLDRLAAAIDDTHPP